jgi:hypothetical protein
VISVGRGYLGENEGIGERAELFQRRARPQLAAGGDREAFDVTGQKVLGVPDAPELRRDRETIGSKKQRNYEPEASAHVLVIPFVREYAPSPLNWPA